MSFHMTCLKQTIVREPNPSHFTTHWVLIITYSSNDLVEVDDVQQKKNQFETFVGNCLGPSRHDSLACHISLTAIMIHIKANITKGSSLVLWMEISTLQTIFSDCTESRVHPHMASSQCWHPGADMGLHRGLVPHVAGHTPGLCVGHPHLWPLTGFSADTSSQWSADWWSYQTHYVISDKL